MHDQQVLLRTLSGFASRLIAPYDVDETMQELAEQATNILDLLGSGVSLLVDGQLSYATAVPEAVAALERAQVESQEGPCMEACRSGKVVAVEDLTQWTDGWAYYRATAHELGIGAVAGVPMSLNDTVVGAVKLYAEGPRTWTDEDLDTVGVLADMCTGLLINASQVRQQQQLNEQLQQALDSRVVIEQAKGIVANTHGESVEQAFDRIRRHARDRNATLRSVARAVVDLGLRV